MITTEYDRSSIISMDASREFKKQVNVTVPDNMQTYPVMISFLKTEIDVSEEISLNTFPNLISSVGGNVSLFTGFSFLTALFVFLEWLSNFIGGSFGHQTE